MITLLYGFAALSYAAFGVTVLAAFHSGETLSLQERHAGALMMVCLLVMAGLARLGVHMLA
ncbi:MAG: hypothetical protein N4A61_15300 [Pelagimonas sp.]|nr:hypothetical protein [Pelagimonas sp.]